MSGDAGTGPASRRHWRLGWFALMVVAVGLSDGIVLANVKALFGSGYNGRAIQTGGEAVAFFSAGAILDAALLATLWWLFSFVLRPFIAGLRRDIVALGFAAATPVFIDMALHRLHATLGDVLALDLLLELTGGDARGGAEEVLSSLPSLVVVVAATVVGLLVLAWISRAIERHAQIGSGSTAAVSGRRLATTALCLGVAALVTWAAVRGNATLSFGLGWKPSGMAVRALSLRLTDFDFDGAGALSYPIDPAPFDRDRHPLAADIPGNGVDENGLAGDLAPGFAPSPPLTATAPATLGADRAVVLVFLESFRADLVGMEIDGRSVTPELNALARDGVSTQHAFTHTAMTWPARAQLFQGRVRHQLDAETLVDDFSRAGYWVGWLSGQHDGLRDGERHLGFDHADHFRDARANLEQRTSRSAQPISLQVSAQTVLAELDVLLEARDVRKPVFLYVNLVDTHFPYVHRELQSVVDHEPLERNQILRENREQVWRAYLNAAANVDRAIGALRARLASEFGPDGYALVITADHGEAFYEPRFLGHGQALDETQTGVPLIVWGLGGDWPEPIALSDLRGVITAGTHQFGERGRFRPDRQRGLLQYAGPIERPKLVGLRSYDRRVEWAVHVDAPPVDDPDFDRMVWTWESWRGDVDAPSE